MQKHDEVKEELIQTDIRVPPLVPRTSRPRAAARSDASNPRHLDRRRDRAQSAQDPKAPPQRPHGRDHPHPDRGGPSIGLTAPSATSPRARSFPLRFAREAWPFVLPPAVAAVVLFAFGIPTAGAAAAVLAILLLLFFRDPGSHYEGADDVVLAPAWGKVLRIEAAQDPAVSPEPLHRIVTFLSVFDVHLQRAPISGRIVHSAGNPGRRVAAFRHDAGDDQRRAADRARGRLRRPRRGAADRRAAGAPDRLLFQGRPVGRTRRRPWV